MDPDSLLNRLQSSSRISLTREELEEVLVSAEVVSEEDTCISGMLRILRLENGTILVQEETPKREVLVRARPNLAAAEEFVRGRLQVYERMWDGCGCRVDYEEP